MHHYCTYFDEGFVARGLALADSLAAHDPGSTLWVLCFDESTTALLQAAAVPAIRPIPLAELLAADPELAAVRSQRTRVEFYFTCTAAWINHVLRSQPDVDVLTYIDADLYLFASPKPLFDAFADASVSLIPHRFAPAYTDMERNGVYNVGWLTFRRDERGLTALRWWRERCIEWCYDRHEGGKYGDQKYLDDWPTRFPGVVVLKHPGADLAPWNLGRHQLAQTADGQITVDGHPLIFFHFHGLKQLLSWLFDPHLANYGATLTPIVAAGIYQPYLQALQRHRRLAPIRYRLRGNGWRLLVRRLLWYPYIAWGLLRGRFLILRARDE